MLKLNIDFYILISKRKKYLFYQYLRTLQRLRLSIKTLKIMSNTDK